MVWATDPWRADNIAALALTLSYFAGWEESAFRAQTRPVLAVMNPARGQLMTVSD